jgi:predicted ATPase
MHRFILTGAPGSGKTSIIRQLELGGFGIVEEAATDIIALQQTQGIAEPWTKPSFIDAVTLLQRERQLKAAMLSGEIQFHDRSIICTVALAKYLEYPIPDILRRELDRLRKERIFEQRIFFIQNLGFITATEARRISFEETLRFEKIHEETYRDFGFEICFVPAGDLSDRVAAIKKEIAER